MFKKAVFAVLVVGCLVWAGCGDSDSGRSAPPPRSGSGGGSSSASRSGQSAPRSAPGEGGASLFRLPMVDGQAVTVKTPAALYFFTTWCGYCQQALPQIKSLASKAQSRGWRVYGIDVNEDPNQVAAYIQRSQPNFPVLLDQDGRVARQYNVPGYPTFVLIDKNGNIVYQGHQVPTNF